MLRQSLKSCATFATLALLAASPSLAQTPAQPTRYCWIDVKTLKPVNTVPAGITDGFDQANAIDRGTAFNPKTGRNFARQPCPPPQQAKTNPPSPTEHSSAIKLDPTSAQMLAMQNAARTDIGVPPLIWDPALAASAAAYGPTLVQLGQLVHAPRKGRENERENLSMSPHGVFSAGQLIDRWLSEKRNFIPGIFPDVSRTGNWSDVAHYSQIVWPTTTHVGCAMTPGPRFDFLICRYSPPGNADGKPVGEIQEARVEPPNVSDNTSIDFDYSYLYTDPDVSQLHGFGSSLFVNGDSWLSWGSGVGMDGLNDASNAYFPVPGFVVGPPRVGLDVNICSGSSDSQINRHRPGGDVDLDASTNVVLDMLFKCEVSVDTTIAPPPLSETPPPPPPPTPLEPPMR